MAITLQHNKITFPNGSTQNAQGLESSGGTVNGITALNGLTFGNNGAGAMSDTGGQSIQQYYWTGTMTSNSTVWLFANTWSYSDIHFFAVASSNSGGYYFSTWSGTFGGYGANWGQKSNQGNLSLAYSSISPGYSKLGLTMGAQGSSPGTVSFQCILFGGEPVSTYVGTLNP